MINNYIKNLYPNILYVLLANKHKKLHDQFLYNNLKMNSRKKILIFFAIILLFLLLYGINFLRLQDIGDEKKEVLSENA